MPEIHANRQRIMAKRRKNKIIIFLVALLLIIAGALLYYICAEEEIVSPDWAEKLLYSCPFSLENEEEKRGLSVEFIDVGQGDCALIVCGGKSMLIDSGEKEYYLVVESHLREKGIEKLDFLVATHPHSDHIGSMSRIAQNFEIGTFIMPVLSEDILPDTEVYDELIDTLDENKINVETVSAGDKYLLSGAEISVLGPCGEHENLNDMSVVFMLTYGESRFLFTGDIEKDGEKAILESGAELKCDVLKVAHNGSDTSTSDEFLLRADPDIAVISVGEGNKYGHPKRNIIKKLLKSGAIIYRTDDDGTVSFSVSSENSEIVED